ncbi:hypothetical protein AYO44_10125 [Planctomycetaceae bacterium SCGC AG-212-F19]|nr:hypothetical protein AYO44_10125 [Planctomycetaceae bacterium SCGC AG-212-F19]
MDDLRDWRDRADAAYQKAESLLDREDVALQRTIACLRVILDRRGRHTSMGPMPGEREARPRRVHRVALYYVI